MRSATSSVNFSGYSRFTAPFGLQIVSKDASGVVITRFKLVPLIEKGSRLRHTQLALGYPLHGQVPLRTPGGEGRGLLKDSPGFSGAFLEEFASAFANGIDVTITPRTDSGLDFWGTGIHHEAATD